MTLQQKVRDKINLPYIMVKKHYYWFILQFNSGWTQEEQNPSSLKVMLQWYKNDSMPYALFNVIQIFALLSKHAQQLHPSYVGSKSMAVFL